ncbi:threonine--tRNA ligase [Gloeobacter morelensis]|uniref:Threonine--tRNA ligase n=1 Tax=Gloeobacter morelensis MG652769 TaxID=2781736 RepID=A0ABY3PHQ3_9CYAN|nr:threonine--tRNA ligase [Gloeobacter morelensis]UFP93193.1 threonine--tRNA ligase [Gloeobacter morelensis MG652769]
MENDILRQSDPEKLHRIRHSTSHILAMAVQKLFPETKVTIGPAIENGFYYDFDRPTPFTPEDLKKIEKEMRRIVQQKLPMVREEVPREAMRERLEALGEPYKLELFEGFDPDAPVSLYRTGDWWDLCAGPHVESTAEIHPNAFKLRSVAGAYWRGDEKRAQLQRIYGTAWETPEQLEEFLRREEEAKKRDHRKLGRELGLFVFSDLVGPGLPMWAPKGALLRYTLEEFLRKEQVKRGYQQVVTPHIARVDLFKTSGHWFKYKDDMFPLMATGDEEGTEEGFVMKPMNCPFHIQIYKSGLHSYRDLPIRLAEFGTVYRYEQSGELGGLTRVRGFTVDDSHLFVTPEQLDDEFKKVVDLIQFVFRSLQLGDGFSARLSFRDPTSDKYIGSDESWEKAQAAILKAAQDLGLKYFVAEGEAAFYGPKLDFIFRDALGREWQLGTVQVDYILPERFELEYVAEDGSRRRPVMIHRAPFGSLERFIGILIEHFAGDFPLWLAPEQVRILPVTDQFVGYAESVKDRLVSLEMRAEVDASSERLGKKIRNGETAKVPVLLVVGESEANSGTVAVRTRVEGEKDKGTLPVEEAIAYLQERLAKRT